MTTQIINTNTTETAIKTYSRLLIKPKLKQLYRIWVNSDLVNGHGIGGNDFKPAETLALEILWASKFLPRSIIVNHGQDNNEREADIVVNNSVQIEVVTAMAKGYNLDEQILAFAAHERYFTIPDAVEAKFDKKYTDKYRKELFMLLTGDNMNTMELTGSVLERLKNRERYPNNLFRTIYLARYDLMLDGYDLTIISDYDGGEARVLCRVIIPCNNTISSLIKRRAVTLGEIEKESFYFIDVDTDRIDYVPPLVVRGKDVSSVLEQCGIAI